jgi:hypothetical protein
VILEGGSLLFARSRSRRLAAMPVVMADDPPPRAAISRAEAEEQDRELFAGVFVGSYPFHSAIYCRNSQHVLLSKLIYRCTQVPLYMALCI